MPAKTDTATEDHAIKLYLAGEPVEKIFAECGVSGTLLHRIRERRSIPTRPRIQIDAEQIVTAYGSGASEYALSRQYGVSRGSISRVLKEAGIERRGMSDAGSVRNAGLTEEQRKIQTAEAHKAVRNRRLPEIEKFRRALTIECQGRPGSDGEIRLRQMLRERNVEPTVERAIGPYNVDLAMLPIAVEVLGGGFHGVKARHAERTPCILDAGWHLVMVWNYEGLSALGDGAADYLVTFADQIRRNPPATCQYRVISGQGKLLTARGREDGEFPLVPPPRGAL